MIFTIENKNYLLYYTEIVTVTFWCIFFQKFFSVYIITLLNQEYGLDILLHLTYVPSTGDVFSLSILKTVLCTDCVMLYFGMYSCSEMFMLPPRMNDAALNRLAFHLWPSS